MGLPKVQKRYTVQEYYALERDAAYRSEFYRGEIFAMAGGTVRHSLICTNISGELRAHLKGKPCTVFESNLRLKIKATGLRTYPDVSIYCGSFERDEEDPAGETLTNPTVLFEVLSKSTEGYDRGSRADNYRHIESLAAYAFVSQEAAHMEIFERQSCGDWLFREARGRDAVLSIPALSIELPLTEVYDRVDFNEAAAVGPEGVIAGTREPNPTRDI